MGMAASTRRWLRLFSPEGSIAAALLNAEIRHAQLENQHSPTAIWDRRKIQA
jgi:hypothetical protein